jgi:hypothetical protein
VQHSNRLSDFLTPLQENSIFVPDGTGFFEESAVWRKTRNSTNNCFYCKYFSRTYHTGDSGVFIAVLLSKKSLSVPDRNTLA